MMMVIDSISTFLIVFNLDLRDHCALIWKSSQQRIVFLFILFIVLPGLLAVLFNGPPKPEAC